ncbi:flagellar basal-body MS-ring/collar protein FliF [Piscinibacter koreensis]|uniref:Flagellar M-ring protein n=1 Tax=Piscinibacter koreensis TaxID=2742824 RepID=A0A7Y6NMQ9_9BURK|nr:flagellar basal-body MS-ring/collar protein FliF [Schlegelella koreensis]NUZ05939.1 flagellar M-ring protein FliF [Schlegelella koreensis]
MDNALAVKQPVPMAVPATLGGRLMALPSRVKIGVIVGIAALITIAATLALNARDSDYKVLYSNLSDKDGGAVVAQLTQLNVPYKVAPGGAILVPALQVPDLRLKMATAGLPKGTVSGFELMDTARFGQTQFQERLTFQRGLEGELTRSITSLAAVQNARVHLALPNQNGFFREQQKPSASVLLSLHPGRTLDRAQIAGIVHLVSSSVPELDAKAVSVLDHTGALLTSGSDGHAAGLDAQQLQYVNQIETGYTKRILELLEPIVGPNNLRASVTADIDFSQSEATSEEFRPNQGADASVAIRSQQTTEQNGAGTGLPSGVPGAASNQPPAAAAAPLTAASQPLQGGPTTAGNASGRREAVTNYEVDKTVRVTRGASGNVRRVNAAVVVNNRSVTDAKGKTTQVALTNDEIDKLTALVRESVGFKQDRGDSVKVINAPFRVDTTTPVETPWWKHPDTIDTLRAFAMPVALSLVALLIFFGLLRPGAKAVLLAMTPPPPVPGSTIEAVEDAPTPLPALSPPPPKVNDQLESARALARQNPAAVAGILRTWVSRTELPTPEAR